MLGFHSQLVGVTRVYVPRFFVSSQQRFGAMDIKALGVSQLSGLGQTVLQLLGKLVLQLHFIQKIAGESKTRREESGGVCGEGEREREKERERACMHAGERVREKALWLLFVYVFSSTWACPMQIGLSQECSLFCLKSSLWSLDLPLTFLVFQPPPFWTPFPYSTYLTYPSTKQKSHN